MTVPPIKGVVYITRIKDSKDYGAEECFFTIAMKGNSKVGHGEFEFICESNGKALFTKKVKGGKKDPTWEDCLEELEDATPPRGTPIVFTDRVYTFAEIAEAAYAHDRFSNEDGRTRLTRWTSAPKTGKQIVETAKVLSDEMDQVRRNVDVDHVDGMNPFLIPKGNLVYEQEVQEEVVDTVHDVIDGESGGNNEDFENLKERVALAESRASSLEEENEALVVQVAELKSQLESSLANQRQFMVAGDRSGAQLDAINEDCSEKTVRKLSPKLDLLEPLKVETDKISSVLEITPNEENEDEITSIFDTLVTKEDFSQREDALDVTSSTVKEGLLTIKDVLASFGLEDGAEPLSIPGILTQMFDMIKNISPVNNPGPSDACNSQVKPCFFQTRGITGVFACTCGCGTELQADAVLPTQSNPQVMSLNTNDPPKTIVTAGNATDNKNDAGNGNMVGENRSGNPLSRKEKRLLKNKAFINRKKLKPSNDQSLDHPYTTNNGPSSANNNAVRHGSNQPNFVQSALVHSQNSVHEVQFQGAFRPPLPTNMPVGPYVPQMQGNSFGPRHFPSVWMDNRFNNRR